MLKFPEPIVWQNSSRSTQWFLIRNTLTPPYLLYCICHCKITEAKSDCSRKRSFGQQAAHILERLEISLEKVWFKVNTRSHTPEKPWSKNRLNQFAFLMMIKANSNLSQKLARRSFLLLQYTQSNQPHQGYKATQCLCILPIQRTEYLACLSITNSISTACLVDSKNW